MANEIATEIKVDMLSLQEAVDGISQFKILSARPQSTNESCDSFNEDIMSAVSGLENVQYISIAFEQRRRCYYNDNGGAVTMM